MKFLLFASPIIGDNQLQSTIIEASPGCGARLQALRRGWISERLILRPGAEKTVCPGLPLKYSPSDPDP
jgi:hypothetical protein